MAENYQWIFSGIGVLLISVLVSAVVPGTIVLAIFFAALADGSKLSFIFYPISGGCIGLLLGPVAGAILWVFSAAGWHLLTPEQVPLGDSVVCGMAGGAIAGLLIFFATSFVFGALLSDDDRGLPMEEALPMLVSLPLIAIGMSSVYSQIMVLGGNAFQMPLAEQVVVHPTFQRFAGSSGGIAGLSFALVESVIVAGFALVILGGVGLCVKIFS